MVEALNTEGQEDRIGSEKSNSERNSVHLEFPQLHENPLLKQREISSPFRKINSEVIANIDKFLFEDEVIGPHCDHSDADDFFHYVGDFEIDDEVIGDDEIFDVQNNSMVEEVKH